MKYIQLHIKFIVLSFLLIIFTGCSQSAFKYFDKKDEFAQNAQYTKVLKLVQDNTVKAMAYITYLNNANSKKWNNGKENFIIGLYIIDKNYEYATKLSFLEKKKLQLDEENIQYEKIVVDPLSQKALTKADEIYQDIPFRNNWAEYKLVSYKSMKENQTLTFTFTYNKGESVETSFIKE